MSANPAQPPPLPTTTPAPAGASRALPSWAEEMRDLFRSGSIAQFILNGNVFDVVPVTTGSTRKLLPLKQFLDEVMFDSYDTVLHYDRGKGIRPTKGADDWADWLQQMAGNDAMTLAQVRDPGKAMDLIDRYLLRVMNLRAVTKNATRR